MLRSVKIGVRLWGLTGGLLLAAVVLALIGMQGARSVEQRLQDASVAAQSAIKTLDATRAAQVHFKVQVQDWKDILLRGADSASFDKYLDGFTREERAVQSGLAAVRQMVIQTGADTTALDSLIRAHADLGQRYRTALTTTIAKIPGRRTWSTASSRAWTARRLPSSIRSCRSSHRTERMSWPDSPRGRPPPTRACAPASSCSSCWWSRWRLLLRP